MKTHEVETLDPRDKFHGPVHKPHFHMKFLSRVNISAITFNKNSVVFMDTCAKLYGEFISSIRAMKIGKGLLRQFVLSRKV
jgi:cystathionine beta-lyase family protein involved in aluminum resistance